MKEEKNEFLGLLCNLYLVILLVALPLYTGDGYGQLGDVKYTLFRNLSLLCLGGWLVAGMPERIRALAGAVGAWKARQGAAAVYRAQAGFCIFSSVDCAMLLYGIFVTLSAACSSYGKLAWIGYEGWYMGAVSQLIFIGIYFFVSRQYNRAAWPVYLGETAFFLVTLLGLLHRLGIDPLGLMDGWNSKDWEYSHLLSTLGNINWLCGYYSAALAFAVAHFLQEGNRWLQAVLYLVSMSAFVLLFLQGSQGGLLILAACVMVCFFLGWRKKAFWRRMLLLLAGTFFSMPIMDSLMRLRGEKAAVVADGNILASISWYGWLLAAVVCLFLFFLSKENFLSEAHSLSEEIAEDADEKENVREDGSRLNAHGNSHADSHANGRVDSSYERGKIDKSKLPQEENRRRIEDSGEKGQYSTKRNGCKGGAEDRSSGKNTGAAYARNVVKPVVAVLLCTGVMLAALFVWRRIDDSFGSGRGFLWRIAVEGFVQADGKDKLLGAGPDCYAEAVYNRLGAQNEVWKGEHWEGAVFTNAHNEILSQLCNVGILGTACYLAIFLAGMHRYGGSGRIGKNRWRGVHVRGTGRQGKRTRTEAENLRRGTKREASGKVDSGTTKEALGIQGRDTEREVSGKLDGKENRPGLYALCEGGVGVLALAMYGIHSLVSFQQVLNAPLLFLVLGLCEAERRRDRQRGMP